jgi:hypothetical protein
MIGRTSTLYLPLLLSLPFSLLFCSLPSLRLASFPPSTSCFSPFVRPPLRPRWTWWALSSEHRVDILYVCAPLQSHGAPFEVVYVTLAFRLSSPGHLYTEIITVLAVEVTRPSPLHSRLFTRSAPATCGFMHNALAILFIYIYIYIYIVFITNILEYMYGTRLRYTFIFLCSLYIFKLCTSGIFYV